MRPIEYAKASIETMVRTYEAAQLPPEGRFHYHQGVFLSGVYKTYELCKEEKYAQYVKDWIDSVITPREKLRVLIWDSLMICSRESYFIRYIRGPEIKNIRR